MARWFTCSPMRFGAPESSFWRDAGLICRTLRALGHESELILEGPPPEEDPPAVIRGSRAELGDPTWWRRLHLDGLIMNAWGFPADAAIVQAIRAAGIPLVLHLDSSGNAFPWNRRLETLKVIWRGQKGGPARLFWRSLSYPPRVVKWLVRGLRDNGRTKYTQMKAANVVSITTPASLQGNRELCGFYGGREHGVNLVLTALPIRSHYRWDPEIPKEKLIVAIARWEGVFQKRPYVLMDVCRAVAEAEPRVRIEILGSTPDYMTQWHHALPPALQPRILLRGVQPGEAVVRTLQRAQAYLSPSSFESGPQTVYEGLCCGATTVSLDSPELAAARHAADFGHADLASKDTPASFVEAIRRALRKWESGEYDPAQISAFWCEKTHVDWVVRRMLLALER